VAGQSRLIRVNFSGSTAQEENVTRTFSRTLLTVSVTLIAALNARAEEPCSTSQFRGVFGALAQGSLIFVPPGSGIPTGPTARVARVDVDGAGNATVHATLSFAGLIFQESYSGPYSVNPDCTMTVTLNVPFPGGLVIPLTFDGAISGDMTQNDIMIVNPPGTTVRITLRKQTDKHCESKDLNGGFMVNMGGTNFFQPGNPPGSFVRVGRVQFDGQGGFTAATHASHNGLIAEEMLVGNYAVDSDCRFKMNFTLSGQGYTWSGMLFDKSQQAYLLESAPQGAVIIGDMRQQNEREGEDNSDR
jgi:hypothetical protein